MVAKTGCTTTVGSGDAAATGLPSPRMTASTVLSGVGWGSWELSLTKDGSRAADGTYSALVEATTGLGTRTLSLPLTLDTRAPAVRVISARVRDGRTHLRLWLSEPATLHVRYASPDWRSGGLRTAERPAGYSRITLPRAAKVRLWGVDAAANVGARVTARTAR